MVRRENHGTDNFFRFFPLLPSVATIVHLPIFASCLLSPRVIIGVRVRRAETTVVRNNNGTSLNLKCVSVACNDCVPRFLLYGRTHSWIHYTGISHNRARIGTIGGDYGSDDDARLHASVYLSRGRPRPFPTVLRDRNYAESQTNVITPLCSYGSSASYAVCPRPV